MPLGKTPPDEALSEALAQGDRLADAHETNGRLIRDPYLKIFVGILGNSAREDRRLLSAMIEAEEKGQIQLGADEADLELDLERMDASEAA